MSDDRVAVPRKRLSASHRLDEAETEWAVANEPHLHRYTYEARKAIEALAARETTLLVRKPRVTITVTVDWDGYAFPEDAQDIYEAERVGQALGMTVPASNDTLVFMRAPKWLPILDQG